MNTALGPSTIALSVKDLVVEYPARHGRPAFRAVSNVSFDVRSGSTLGLVGESGSGKSTTAQAVLGLTKSRSGSIHVLDNEVSRIRRGDLRRLRSHIQLVMQNPYSSLNPRMSIATLIQEPMRIFGVPGGISRDARTAQLLDMVGLPTTMAGRYPHELSGGQRQRVSIARALSIDPEILVCDEALSALDVSIRAQILELLAHLQEQLGLTMLFISHDLAVVRTLCHDVAVMRAGSIVELGPTAELFDAPREDYTKQLLAAAPRADPATERARLGRGDDTLDRFPAEHFAAESATAPAP